MLTVKRSELSSLKMVASNEKKFSKVIDGDTVKEWIGFGWIDLGEPSDKEKISLPKVVD